MMKHRSAILFLFAAMTCGVSAQEKKKPGLQIPATPAKKDPGVQLHPLVKARVESFFVMLKDGRTQDCYKKLFEGSSIAKEQPAVLDELIENTSKVMEKCGRIESTELVSVQACGSCLRKATYIINCQYQPLRWNVYAYFGEGRWQILDTEVAVSPSVFFPKDSR